MQRKPSYNLEKELLNKVDLVFGMDEVGRGSFAGPLVASAVCFENEYEWFKDINDSKLLAAKKRELLSKYILKSGKCFTEIVEIAEINQKGIGKCNQLVFERLITKVLSKHKKKKVHFLIDGRKQNIQEKNINFIIKGDNKIISIAAASIIAKVFRDKLMTDLEEIYKGYGFSQNKGYGTKFHQDAIKKLGICAIHRTSFNLRRYI
jgi:ribonuclease HII